MGQLDRLHKEEITILVAIVALSMDLPERFTSYAEAIGEIRRKWFSQPGRTLAHKTRGYIDGHQIRASQRPDLSRGEL